jgi:RNA polymerase sigma-70 factor (ECF subfamily)
VNGEKDQKFEKLFAYYPGVLAFLKRFGFSPDEASDLAQDAFVRVYEHMDDYRAESLWSYVQAVTRTVALNVIRSRHTQKREAILEPEEKLMDAADPRRNPEEEFAQESGVRRIMHAIDRLDPKSKQCMLWSIAGFSYAEMTKTFDVTESALKSRLHEARNKLKEFLGEEPEGWEDKP